MMNKTKVRVSLSLQDYCQAMTERVNDARDEKLWITAESRTSVEPFEDQVEISTSEKGGLLTPPRIEVLMPQFYLADGEVEGIILLITSDLFGIAYIYVTLRDEAGNLLDGGYAMPDENYLGCWAYPPLAYPTVGSSVIVRAVAADVLGGMDIAQEELTLTNEYLAGAADLLERMHNR